MRFLIATIVLLGACKFNERDFGGRSCAADKDCKPDETCSDNQCAQKGCTKPSDCGIAAEFQCESGACVAQSCSANGNDDCAAGFVCGDSNYCRPKFDLLTADSLSNTSIAVTFDAPPDETSAKDLANYSITGLTLSGTPTIAGSVVTLTTSSQLAQTYTVTATGVTRAGDHAPIVSGSATFIGRTAFNVASATAITSRTVMLTFDAMPNAAEAATLANYSITGLTLSGTPMVVGNTVTLIASSQAVTSYTVTVAGVHRMGDGEGLAKATAMFTGRNDFNVFGAAATSSHSITVTFDAAANSAQATTLGNYSIVNSSQATLALSGAPTLSGDGLTVTLTTAVQQAGNYTVTVNNVTRALDAEPLNVKTAGFAGRIPFNVFSAASTSSTSLSVTFDATPVMAEAQNTANYDIPGLTINSAVLSGNTVTLTTSTQTATSYTVTASNVTRMSDGEPLTIAAAGFTGRASFNVASAQSVTSHTVYVTFDAAPNAAQATVASKYTIPGVTVTNAAYPGTGNVVTLTTSAQSATQFTVTVAGVTRQGDGEPLTLAVASFTGRAPFNVASAAAVTAHKITVTFDAPPDPATANVLGNYTANNGLTFSGVSYPGTGNTVTLTSSVQTAQSYQVTVANVVRTGDLEPMTVTSAAFTGRATFDVQGAASIGNTTITVTFNAAPDMTQATTLANYTITTGTLTLSGTPVLSGNTVTITTSAQTSNANYAVTVANVTRASDGEPLTITNAPFKGKSGFNVASASSVSTTSMSVTFDAAPDMTTATNVNNYVVPGLTLSGPVTLVGNTVTMTTTAQAGQTYTVTVSNVIRASDSVALTNPSASFTHTLFNVASAAATTSHQMTVTFDALPNTAQATTLTNYSVKDAQNNTLALSGTVTLNSGTNTVTITTAAQTDGKIYTVTVMNVTRASDSTALTTNTAQFTGIGTFDVASAASVTSASITVTFSAPPNATQATTLARYTVPGLTLKGTPILSGNTVTINTTVQSATTYTVTVNGVTRASDGEVLTTTMANFTGTAQTDATVTNVVIQSSAPSNGTTFYNTGAATVVITGTQFSGVSCPTGVTLDDQNGLGTGINTPASSCTVDSDTQITATFPAGIRTNGLSGWGVMVKNTTGNPSVSSAVKVVVKAGLLISEVQIGVNGGGNNTREFFELYNPTGNDIDVTNIPGGLTMSIHFRAGAATDSVVAVSLVSGSVHRTIKSHGFLLISSSQSTADPWYTHRDGTYDASVTELVGNGGLYVSLSTTAQAKVIDKLGWGTVGAGGYEGTALAVLSNGNPTASVQRKPAGGAGDATDTDSNVSDFTAPSQTITPKGTADGIEP